MIRRYLQHYEIRTGLYSTEAYNALWLVKMMGNKLEFPFFKAPDEEEHWVQHENEPYKPWIAVNNIYRDKNDGEICFDFVPVKCYMESQTKLCKEIVKNLNNKPIRYFIDTIMGSSRQLFWKKTYFEGKRPRPWYIGGLGTSLATVPDFYLRYFPSGDINVVEIFSMNDVRDRSIFWFNNEVVIVIKAIAQILSGEIKYDYEINKNIIEKTIGTPMNPFAAQMNAEMLRVQQSIYAEYDDKESDIYFDNVLSASNYDKVILPRMKKLAEEYIDKIESLDYSNC